MEEELRRRQEALEAEVERLREEAEARAAQEEETSTADADTPGEQPDDEGQVAPAEAVDEEVAVAGAGVVDSALPEPEPCDVDLLPGITATAAYPRGGRFNLGDAVMLVRYTVDEDGATPDDEVFVDPEGSSASRARNFDTFAETARQTVRRWEFEFDNPDEHCVRRQEHSIAFEFQYE
ncbi:MAG: hypothetical protein OXK79_03710, partial [Chloroflexota bacterium]|nr:hypothetical protein [Chloroflexota bacterium]